MVCRCVYVRKEKSSYKKNSEPQQILNVSDVWNLPPLTNTLTTYSRKNQFSDLREINNCFASWECLRHAFFPPQKTVCCRIIPPSVWTNCSTVFVRHVLKGSINSAPFCRDVIRETTLSRKRDNFQAVFSNMMTLSIWTNQLGAGN